MKNKSVFQWLIILFLFSLLSFSCNENEPRGDNFNWSPDGKKLLMFTNQSKELLLIQVAKDRVVKVSVVDSAKEEKSSLFAPKWSFDGKYFLYTKSKNNFHQLIIYAATEKGISLSADLKIDTPEKSSIPAHFACWAPQKNQILFTEFDNQKNIQLVTIEPDGSKRLALTTVDCNFLLPQWSPDGACIVYLVNGRSKDSNGLWKVKSDGSAARQIFRGEDISQFQWAPDGKAFVFAQKAAQKDSVFYNILLMDADGKKAEIIGKETAEITTIDWSSDGKLISYLQESDNKKNIWLVDIKSLAKTKLTFNNVENCFGWHRPNQLFFSIKYPESIVKLPEAEKNQSDIHEIIQSISKRNILFSYQNQKFSKIGKNKLYPCINPVFGTQVYFDVCKKPELLGSELYLPAIKFSPGNVEFISRSSDEFVVAADNYIFENKYAKALDQLNRYFGFDLKQNKFRHYFNADSVIAANASNEDSIYVSQVFEALRDGTILKTIYLLNKLNEKNKATWLFEQLTKLTSVYLKDKTNNDDELYWNILAVYGKYNDFEQGIKDTDKMILAAEADSLCKSYLYFSQAFLAFENDQFNLCLEKLKQSSHFMPTKNDELEPFNFLISTCLKNSGYEKNPKIIDTLEQLRFRFPRSRDIYETLIILGDYYAKLDEKDKAFQTYQEAIFQKPENRDCWQKIFALQLK